jgi:hypothetical protein
MFKRLTTGAIIALALTTALAETAAARFRVGVWTGSAYTSRTTGRFSYCQIWAKYRSGIWLYFRQYPNYNLYVGMYRQNWQLRPGGNYTMTFMIDGRVIRRARGIVERANTRRIWLELKTDRYTRNRLQRGFNLMLINNQQRYHFQLRATSVGLAALERCVRRNRYR